MIPYTHMIGTILPVFCAVGAVIVLAGLASTPAIKERPHTARA